MRKPENYLWNLLQVMGELTDEEKVVLIDKFRKELNEYVIMYRKLNQVNNITSNSSPNILQVNPLSFIKPLNLETKALMNIMEKNESINQITFFIAKVSIILDQMIVAYGLSEILDDVKLELLDATIDNKKPDFKKIGDLVKQLDELPF